MPKARALSSSFCFFFFCLLLFFLLLLVLLLVLLLLATCCCLVCLAINLVAVPPWGRWFAAAIATEPGGAFALTTVAGPVAPHALFLLLLDGTKVRLVGRAAVVAIGGANHWVCGRPTLPVLMDPTEGAETRGGAFMTVLRTLVWFPH